MKEHCHRSYTYARKMNNLGVKVIYPRLEDHPQYALLKSIVNSGYRYGGMLCVDMDMKERAYKLMYHLQNYTQFGLMAGISPGWIQISIGYNGTLEQKWSQFENAVDNITKVLPCKHKNGM